MISILCVISTIIITTTTTTTMSSSSSSSSRSSSSIITYIIIICISIMANIVTQWLTRDDLDARVSSLPDRGSFIVSILSIYTSDWVALLLSASPCLIRPHLLYALFKASRITRICRIIRQFFRKHALDK